MKQQNETFTSSPLSLVLHELHPAYDLHPDIRNRLTNTFNQSDQEAMRKFSKRSLIQMAEQHIIVTGSKRAPSVISGWGLLHSLQMYQIEDPITCVAKWRLPESKIRELCHLDFFIRPQIERYDEIAQRIRAIIMDRHIGDHELKELLSIDAAAPKYFYDLPVHKGNRLEKSLQPESGAVRNLVSGAPRPLGTKEPQTSNVKTTKAEDPSHVDGKESAAIKGAESIKQEKIGADTSPAWDDLFGSDEP